MADPTRTEGAARRLDPDLPGPFGVGRYARELQGWLRGRAKVLVIGEVTGFKRARANSYFELRDADGALPCSIWNSDLDRLGIDEAALRECPEAIVAGGLDYYPGSATSSPGFSFRVTHLRLAGEGDLLARLAALRRQLQADGLFEPQKRLPRPALPKTIGVVTARGSAACADLLAGFERRGWRGTIVWADAPVQDRRAAPRIAAALRGLAEAPQVDVAVVCRGGGSLADLWAFCDEGLCRTVAMLRLPVVSAVGHESDRTLIDDVAAVSCSTPTHAAEALVAVDVNRARAELGRTAAASGRAGRAAVRARARRLAELAGAPERSVRAERARLHQELREIRAAAARGVEARGTLARTHALVVARKAAAAVPGAGEAARGIDAFDAAIAAHHPQRTLERGYALVESAAGDPITSGADARRERSVRIRFAEEAVRASVEDEDDGSG
jgi:exodeoxyribonuclease VII large subunit